MAENEETNAALLVRVRDLVTAANGQKNSVSFWDIFGRVVLVFLAVVGMIGALGFVLKCLNR